ncbi:uncharacterized protein LOC144557499 isoform X2 [Carex rostrata]
MEFERRELRDDGRGASFYASSSSTARYPSDAGLSRYGIRALGSSSQCDQVRQLSYNTDSAFLETRRCSGPPGPSLQGPLLDHSYHEDLELEICRDRLREVADMIELSHFRMLEAHDRRVLAIAERDPYARRIPFYPALPPDNGQIQGVRSEVQKNLNLGPYQGPRAGVEGPPILRREEVVPHAGLNGARSHYQPIGPVEAVCPVGPARDVRIDERSGHDPIYQNQFTGYDIMRPPHIIHELPLPLVVPVPVRVPSTQNIGSSAETNKKRKKEYGQEVVQVKPSMSWSKWPCVWCSVNFDSKEAMDAHLKEQHQGCIGNGPSESEKVENNRNEETRHGLTVMGHGNQEEISEVSGLCTNKKIPLYLPPANLKRKSDESHKGDVVPTLEYKEVAGSDMNKKIKLVLPLFYSTRKSDESIKEEVEPTPEDKEIAGSSTTKKMKLYLPPSNLRPIPNELVQTPEDKEIAGSSINRKMKLDLSPSNLEQIPDEPSKEEVVPIPENKEISGSSINRNMKLDLSPSNLEQIPDKPSKEEVVPIPENKEIAGSSIYRKMKLDLSPSNLKQIPNKPSKEEVAPTPKNKEKPATCAMKPGWVVPEDGWFCDLCNVNALTERALDDHSHSSAHLKKLNPLPTGSQKSEPASKIVAEKPVQGVSQAVSVPELEEQKEKTSKSILMLQSDKLKEVSQAVSVPELEEQKEKTSKSILMPQSAKEKEVLSQDKGNPSSSDRTVIIKGHGKTTQPAPKFSKKKNSITKPFVVMRDGKWFCNLCGTKRMSGNIKEDHIKGKKHRMNLQSQAVSHTPDWVVQKVGCFCDICKIKIFSMRTLDDHFQSNAHHEKLQALLYGSLKSEKIVAEKPVQELSQAVSVPKLKEAKEETLKSIPIPQSDNLKEVRFQDKGNLEEAKGETSRSIPMPQSYKLKEAASQDKGNPSSSNKTVVLTGHKKPAQQNPMFSNKKNGVPVNGITRPVVVMKDGKWFCKLCETKEMNENAKENHIKGKKHWMNLQSQAVSHTAEPKKPSAKHWCSICNIYCMNENDRIPHINGKKHREALIKYFA